jgi:hypothetical protein
MAVCASNVALLYLALEFRQRHRGISHCANGSDLHTAYMVEFENDNVCGAAINARVAPQELDDELAVYCPLMLRSRIQRRAERRTVVAIVFRVRVMLTGSAIRLKSIGATNSPCESLKRLEFTAPSTPLHVRSIANACASVVAL